MKKLFKDWTKFEIRLLIISLITVVVSGMLCKSTGPTIICSITGIICALTQAKGKIRREFFK